MEWYNINVLGFSETKARGNGSKVEDIASYVYSEVTESRGKCGLAIVLERYADCVKSCRYVRELKMPNG